MRRRGYKVRSYRGRFRSKRFSRSRRRSSYSYRSVIGRRF